MKYEDQKTILKNFYDQMGLSGSFEQDNKYLESAFNEIAEMWYDNLAAIEEVRYLMIAEAPMWGKSKKYIYHAEANQTQFLYRNDLGAILNEHIEDNESFIRICNKIGFLVVDISPFPLNPVDTAINYRKMTKEQYRQLVSATIPTFFNQKIKAIKARKAKNIQTFFRYARVRNHFEDLISQVLIDQQIIETESDILDISKRGGGVDREKLGSIIHINQGLM